MQQQRRQITTVFCAAICLSAIARATPIDVSRDTDSNKPPVFHSSIDVTISTPSAPVVIPLAPVVHTKADADTDWSLTTNYASNSENHAISPPPGPSEIQYFSKDMSDMPQPGMESTERTKDEPAPQKHEITLTSGVTPEPGSLSLFAVASLYLLRRRRPGRSNS